MQHRLNLGLTKKKQPLSITLKFNFKHWSTSANDLLRMANWSANYSFEINRLQFLPSYKGLIVLNNEMNIIHKYAEWVKYLSNTFSFLFLNHLVCIVHVPSRGGDTGILSKLKIIAFVVSKSAFNFNTGNSFWRFNVFVLIHFLTHSLNYSFLLKWFIFRIHSFLRTQCHIKSYSPPH